ncbi:MAG: hypothetical protein ISR46_03670 [Rhodospirillales bacterium]|nr:hypothetical protein [Rhodospirillales bacterium]
MEASKAGPLPGPIAFSKKRGGIGGTVADAEANPKEFMFAQGGTRVSLQTALNSGLVKKHSDGQYYDYRVDPSSFSEGDNQKQSPQQEAPEDTQEDASDAPDTLTEVGYEMSEEGAKAVGKLQEVNSANPDLVDDAITKLVSSNGEVLNKSSFVEGIANESGMTREEASEVMTTSIDTYREAAASVIEATVPGLDGQDFLDHIRATDPNVANRMVYAQMSGDFTVHKEAAREYLSNLPKINKEAALSADLGANAKAIEVNGQVMVDFNGKRLTWAEAMKYR